MKIATYNVNGINGRFPVLLRWLERAQPDIVCLQELKSPQERFPKDALEKAGYGAIWHGQKSWNGVAILAKGANPIETRRGLPGDPDDVQSRYIEAAVKGLIVGCLYMPNGNPAPGPKFDYKLAWFKRLHKYAGTLLKSGHPVVLAGDYNVMPTDLDVYKPERWLDDALFRPEVRKAYAALVQQGWTDALRALHPDERIYTFWDYFRNAYVRDAGLRIDHLLLTPDLAKRLKRAEVDTEVRGWEKTSDHAPVWIELKGARAKKVMPRKLKTFITNIGFFELALAAPSMKAALEAWGMGHNAFQHGFAKQTDDPKIVAATMASPGVVLRRAVGTKGEFTEHSELPKDLWKLEAPKAEPVRPKVKAPAKQPAKPKPAADDKKDRAAILSFEKAKQRRDAAREKEQAEANAKREKAQARIERDLAKAEDALDRAKAHHEKIAAAIAADQEKLDRRTAAEKKRWDAERAKLEEARERATRA